MPASLPVRHCRLPIAVLSMLQLAPASPFCAAAAAASPWAGARLRTSASSSGVAPVSARHDSSRAPKTVGGPAGLVRVRVRVRVP